jgi:hypothetical protein
MREHMAYNPKSLANLKIITPEIARENQRKSVEAKRINKEMREKFKLQAKNMQEVINELPQLDALGILNLGMIKALEDDDFLLAAQLAEKIAEYQKPKLQRIDQTNINRTYSELSDEELEAELNKHNMSSLVDDTEKKIDTIKETINKSIAEDF